MCFDAADVVTRREELETAMCGLEVDMHTKVARSLGETGQPLYAVGVWRETLFFSGRERAALAWAEAVTCGSSLTSRRPLLHLTDRDSRSIDLPMPRHRPSLAFILRPVPPFRLDLTVWALRRRARNAIDRWDGATYRRVIVVRGRPTELAMRQGGSTAAPRLIVTATPSLRTSSERQRVRSIVERLLGLRIDLAGWYRLAERDPRLNTLANRFRGLKPPRFPTVFEALVNGFACQQLSLVVGLELLNRLAAVCNVRRGTAGDVHYGFPTPRDVVRLSPSRYQAIGFSRQKVRALLVLARALERREIDLESLGSQDDDQVRARLLELRGVGRWTAEYVMLRGLGRLHVFPGDDVGAQNRFARWLGRSASLDYAGVRRAVAPWQPYAGLVYFHLLLEGLAPAGALPSTPEICEEGVQH